MLLLYLSISWLAGIILGSYIAPPIWLFAISLIVLVPVFLFPRYRMAALAIAFCYLAVIGGALRYQATVKPLDNTQVQYFNDKGTVRITGMIAEEPEVKHASTAFRFAVDTIAISENKTPVTGDVLVRLPFYREVRYGDMLELTGKLETPEKFDNFDYSNYLAGQGIYSIMNYPGTTLLERGKGFLPLSWIYQIRDKLAQSLSLSLPEPQSSLAQAILLGLRGSIPADLTQSFYYTGTTHLLAISGLNLTIILGMILSAAIWLLGRKNRIYIWLSLSLIWLYTALTGMPATVVRAAIMGSVFLIAELLGRQRNTFIALTFTAALMVSAEPLVIRETSFQLSFLSMLGLTLMLPYFSRFIESPAHKGTFTGWLKNLSVIGFGSTVAAVLATWPVIAVSFHQFSLVTMPATFFAMPSLPGIIVTSFLTATAGIVWQPLGYILGWIAWLFLSYFLLVIQIFSALPYVFIQNINLAMWQIILYYALLTGFLLSLKYSARVRDLLKLTGEKTTYAFMQLKKVSFQTVGIYVLTALLTVNILLWIAFANLPDGKLHVSILDVGQGDSILIRTPRGQNILVDSGPDAKLTLVQLGKSLPFWERNIDLLIHTQPQSDHTYGSLYILSNYHVKNLAISPLSAYSGFERALKEIIDAKAVPVTTVHAGQEYVLGNGINLAVLHPRQVMLEGTADDINNNSLVLRLSWGKVSFLLASDIEEECERYLIENRADLKSDVLKVAHHGSRNSTTDTFLSIVQPAVAVISAGENNRFGHPHREMLDRLADWIGAGNVFITTKCGTLEFSTDGRRLWYKTEKIPPK